MATNGDGTAVVNRGDQRDFGRATSPVDLRRGRVPTVSAGRAGAVGWPRTYASAGCGDDHGLDRHLLVELDPQPATPSANVLGRHADDSRGGRDHA